MQYSSAREFEIIILRVNIISGVEFDGGDESEVKFNFFETHFSEMSQFQVAKLRFALLASLRSAYDF